MRRAYLDTEFTTLNQYRYKLISLALVVPQGPELYVELTDAWTESDCSDFVLEIVLPQLDLDLYGRTTEQARAELLSFLRALGPVEIICDAPDWDWPLLAWLPLWLLMHYGVIRREEAYLLRRFGQAYANYLQHTRRWL